MGRRWVVRSSIGSCAVGMRCAVIGRPLAFLDFSRKLASGSCAPLIGRLGGHQGSAERTQDSARFLSGQTSKITFDSISVDHPTTKGLSEGLDQSSYALSSLGLRPQNTTRCATIGY